MSGLNGLLARHRGRAVVDDVRQQYWADARHLVLQLAGRAELHSLDHYRFGLALPAGEIPYRCLHAQWRLREDYTQPVTRNGVTSAVHWNPVADNVFCLLTSEQVAVRDPQGQLWQLYWNALAGVSVNLEADQVLVDYTDGRAGLFTGPTIAVIAVAAVARVYGLAALLEHPNLNGLRADS